MFDNFLYIFFAGVVQGLTEFLPISSSGHLVILNHFFYTGRVPTHKLNFEIILHFGTVF